MKYIILSFLLFTGTAIVLPIQKEETKYFDLKKGSKVELNLKFADSIYIRGVKGNQLRFHSKLRSTDKDIKDAYSIEYEEYDGTLSIKTDVKHEYFENKSTDDTRFNNDTKLITYEIELPQSTELSVETISGNIEIRELKQKVKAKSISGFIDMDWDETPADLHLSSVTGEVYSDINLNLDTPIKEMPIVGYPLKGRIKNGGASVHLESVSNHIFFRKR